MDTIMIDGLAFALPLLIMAVGGIFSERSGITMLALEGLQGFGAFAGALAVTLVRASLGADSPYLIYIAMLAAMVGGALFSIIHALLCVNFKAEQVISGVVVNTLSMALTVFLTSIINDLVMGEASNRFQLGVSPRFSVPLLSGIPIFGGLFKQMYPFQIVILAITLYCWYLLYKTRFGLHLRACGENPHSLDAAGGHVEKTQFRAVLICGALSGLGGIFIAYSVSGIFSPTIYMGYGYLSIAALIFGNWKIPRTFLICLFFGFAKSAGYQICLTLGMPSRYTDLLLILPYVLTLLLLVFFSKHNHPPRAVGESFDRGKR